MAGCSFAFVWLAPYLNVVFIEFYLELSDTANYTFFHKLQVPVWRRASISNTSALILTDKCLLSQNVWAHGFEMWLMPVKLTSWGGSVSSQQFFVPITLRNPERSRRGRSTGTSPSTEGRAERSWDVLQEMLCSYSFFHRAWRTQESGVMLTVGREIWGVHVKSIHRN